MYSQISYKHLIQRFRQNMQKNEIFPRGKNIRYIFPSQKSILLNTGQNLNFKFNLTNYKETLRT